MRLGQLQLFQFPVRPFDTSATVLMPCESIVGLAPSITDSPTAKYGRSINTVVVGSVGGGAVWPGAADVGEVPAERPTVAGVVWAIVLLGTVVSISRAAWLSHSI